MIQHNPTRRIVTSVGPVRQASLSSQEEWGTWIGQKHYSLEVVQHPSRARMCGFGDKDRRPLAPAAVAKMVVRKNDNNLVDIDDIDCSFFLVTVDLWSADGKEEMNLVLHPSAGDRFNVPTTSPPKPRKREKNSAAPSTRPESQTPAIRSTPTPSQPRDPPSAPPGYPNQGYPFPPPLIPPSNAPLLQTFSAAPSEHPTWGYPSQNERTPGPFASGAVSSLNSFNRNTPTNAEPWNNESREGEILPFRPWNSEPAYPVAETYGAAVDPSLRNNTENRDVWQDTAAQQQPGRFPTEGYAAAGQSDFGPSQQFSHAPAHHQQPQQQQQHPSPMPYYTPNYASNPQAIPSPAPVQLPRHTYTRTLVGPLSSNATRLLDEHRKPGIFFLFQDLSVRTEGTFRLRLRLMNVGAPPAPEAGAQSVTTGISPVLAQSFTEPFTVYSAKRFPGVPDTTALSIAFGNQGQKLPLRNRHGSSGKRRRRDDSGSDDDSDGG